MRNIILDVYAFTAYELSKYRGAPTIIYVASIEHHGALPIGSDYIIAKCISEKLREVDIGIDVLELPIIPFSVSLEHVKKGFTITVDSISFIQFMKHIISSVYNNISHRIIVIATHGGVCRHIYIVLRELRIEKQSLIARLICVPELLSRLIKERYGLSIKVIHGDPIEKSILCICTNSNGDCDLSTRDALELLKTFDSCGEIPEPWIHTDVESRYALKSIRGSNDLGREVLEQILRTIINIIRSM